MPAGLHPSSFIRLYLALARAGYSSLSGISFAAVGSCVLAPNLILSYVPLAATATTMPFTKQRAAELIVSVPEKYVPASSPIVATM